MKLFTVRLSEDERAKLAEHRRIMGLRSEADVIRRWISGEPYPLVGDVRRVLSGNDSAASKPVPIEPVRLTMPRAAIGSLTKKGKK